jgi:hypothetical protein
MTEPFGHPTRDIDADHMVETPGSLRDDDPEAPPSDRGLEASDRPLGAEKFGTTPAEEREGESLDAKLAQDEPDLDAHDPVEDIVAADPSTFGAAAEEADEAVLADAYGDTRPITLDVADDPVGRLVEPDEGAHPDTEKDAVATAAGDEGDLSAEEAALHVVDQP